MESVSDESKGIVRNKGRGGDRSEGWSEKRNCTSTLYVYIFQKASILITLAYTTKLNTTPLEERKLLKASKYGSLIGMQSANNRIVKLAINNLTRGKANPVRLKRSGCIMSTNDPTFCKNLVLSIVYCVVVHISKYKFL